MLLLNISLPFDLLGLCSVIIVESSFREETHEEVHNQMPSISNGCKSPWADNVGMRSTAVPADVHAISRLPFAVVDEIVEESPAAEDGLQLGDQLVKFGSVESGENLLSRLASEVQKNQGLATSVVVMRQGVLTSLHITPRTWRGNGLLGYV